tara:strand:+ start:470 stop:913 length:444 start_codon:yes stop_codon:yes gene_type:complete
MDDSAQRIVVDCDGVIAGKTYGNEYAKALPLEYGIAQVNRLYDMGYEIVLYTARYGDRENGNMHMQYERGYAEWLDWLKTHKVKYHHAFMGKIAAVLYIDDKAARVNGDTDGGWSEVWKEVKGLKNRDKYGNLHTDGELNYYDSFVD